MSKPISNPMLAMSLFKAMAEVVKGKHLTEEQRDMVTQVGDAVLEWMIQTTDEDELKRFDDLARMAWMIVEGNTLDLPERPES